MMISTAASLAASLYFLRTLIPSPLQSYISDFIDSLFARFSSQFTVTIDEYGEGQFREPMYKSAHTYLAAKQSPSIHRVKVSKPDEDDEKTDDLLVTIGRGQEVVDVFQGVKFTWYATYKKALPTNPRRGDNVKNAIPTAYESNYFKLTFHKKYRDLAIKSYLPFVMEEAKRIREEESKTVKLYTNSYGEWKSVNFRHPATFESMAMEEEMKREVMEDLERFVKRKEYYKRVGKAWKRGYLLYGPPGTGKSSLIAAMANYLRFGVYDLELTDVTDNSELRALLVETSNKSILVVEDIDCTVELVSQRERYSRARGKKDDEKLTLSGLLNFADGLWSSCRDERIIVFTTNHKEKLDAALLRPGRMDMHIYMGYCTFSAFRVLASNYQRIDHHPLFTEIEGLLGDVEVTPAEVAEKMMKSDDAEIALNGLIKMLKTKRKKTAIKKKKKKKAEEASRLEMEKEEEADEVSEESEDE